MINPQILTECHDAKDCLIRYLRNPVLEIKNLPDWSWPKLILFHSAIAAVSGALAGFVEKKFSLSILGGFILSPILTLVTLGVATAFFYYCFQIFAGQTVSLKKLFTVTMFANFPQLILQIVAGYVPPVTLVGMAFTAFLLLVGFVENFKLDRKLTAKFVGGLYAVFVVMWLWNQASSVRFDKSWNSEKISAPEVRLGE